MSKIVKRVEELLGRGFPKSLNLDALSASEIKRLKYRELQAVLGKLNLSKKGKTEDLRNRLYSHYGLPEEEEEEENSSESKPRPKRKWNKTDPARFAPNEYHENLFRANFPFVDVVSVGLEESMPGVDKFEGAVLDHAAKGELFDQWVERIMKASNYFRDPVNEKQAAPRHFALFDEFGDFTRIAAHEAQQLDELLGKRKRESEPVQCSTCQKGSLACSCEANQGIEIEVLAEDLVGRKSSKNAGIEITAEDPSTLEGDLEDPGEVTGYADAVLSVWDDRVRKRRKLDSSIAKGASGSSSSEPIGNATQRCVCVVERKFDDDKYKFWAPFQGGYYAVKNAMRNIQKGHLLPIYVLVMTGTVWSYGKLEVCGLVTLEDGQVDPACMETFQSQQKLGVYTYEMLQKKLEAGTTFYRKHYSDNPTALYRNHTTLVGKFYVMSKWYRLPETELVSGVDQPNTHRLFDGLLRLVVGDSILDWTKEDYDRVWRQRKEYLKMRCRIAGAGKV